MSDSNASTFYLLDLDRTVFNTQKATDVMRGVVAMHDAELAMVLEQRFEEYILLGESFSIRDFIVENIGEEEMQKVEAKYHDVALGHDLLNPGAKELIAYIRTLEHTDLGILTYGSSLGQAMKIHASADLDGVPFLITGETYKGAQIASWRQDDDLYHLPDELGGSVVKTIVFVDDKPFSFKGLPIDCIGYLVKTLYDAGVERLPVNVSIVGNLHDVIRAEKQRLGTS